MNTDRQAVTAICYGARATTGRVWSIGDDLADSYRGATVCELELADTPSGRVPVAIHYDPNLALAVDDVREAMAAGWSPIAAGSFLHNYSEGLPGDHCLAMLSCWCACELKRTDINQLVNGWANELGS